MASLKETTVNGNLKVTGNISTDSTKLDISLLNMIYPVGTLYWTNSKTFNPNTFFGGIWKRIENKFILAASASGNNLPAENATGKITLSTAQLPSHNHGMKHTHTFSGTTSEIPNHTHNMKHDHYYSHTHTAGSMKIEGQTSLGNGPGVDGAGFYRGPGNHGTGPFGSVGDWVNWQPSYSGSKGGYKLKFLADANNGWSGSTSSPSGDGYTGWPTTGSTGTNKGNMYNTGDGGKHTHTYSGTTSTSREFTDNTGSGSEINTMPPYVVKYCWERTN